MTCADARSLLSLDLDGVLPAIDVETLAAHLRGCAACRAARVAMVEETRSLTEVWATVPAPAGFSARVAGTLPRHDPAVGRGWLLRVRTPALGGALALLLVATGLAIPSVRAGIEAIVGSVSLRETTRPPAERRIGGSAVLSADEAQRRLAWRLRMPASLPDGYRLAGVLVDELYSFAAGPSAALYYLQGDGPEAPQLRIVETRVQPGAVADLPVEPGTSTIVQVNGRAAILVDGVWQEQGGQTAWIRGTLLRLIVEDGDFLLSLEADPRDGWDAAGLIRVAESLR